MTKAMIRLVELFSGIGAFSKALTNLGIPHEMIAMCEIDPHAMRVYEALHGPTPNLGDISKVDRSPDCNLLTYSFPYFYRCREDNTNDSRQRLSGPMRRMGCMGSNQRDPAGNVSCEVMWTCGKRFS